MPRFPIPVHPPAGMAENPSSLTVAEAAKRFMVDDRTVRNWMNLNGMPFSGDGKKRRIDWTTALPWYVRYQAAQIGSSGKPRRSEPENPPLESYDDALTRKTVAEADIKQLQLAKARGEVAAIVDVERVLAASTIAVQTQLLALPSQVAPQLLGLEELPPVIKILTAAVHQALTNVATVDAMREASGAAALREED